MGLKEILKEVNDETQSLLSDGFGVEVTKALVLPSVDDPNLTESFKPRSLLRGKVDR